MREPTTGRPAFPLSLSHDPGRRTRRSPVEPPLDSYRTQRYQVVLAGVAYELAPGSGPGPALDLPLPLHLISGWHPHGRPSTRAEGETEQARLLDRVDLRSVVAAVTAYPVDRSWFEPMLAVTGLSDAVAVQLARDSGQLAAVRWDQMALTVLPTDESLPNGGDATGWQWRATGPHCPVVGRAERCREQGGPFGTSAIHAAAISRAHRDLAAALLGCAMCGGGGAGGVSLAPVTVGSRHGGYAWS